MKRISFILTIVCTSFLFSSCYTWFEEQVKMDTEKQRINLGELLYQEKPITSLNPPTQVLVSQGKYSGEIKIHWDEVPYANSYRIERAVIEPDPTTGNYRVPDEGDFTVLNKQQYSNNFVDPILASPSSSNKEYSNRYYYRVSAENIPKGLESSEFTEISVTSCGWLLTPPASIEATKGESSEYIKVTWSAVPQANKYLIYRGEKENGMGMELLGSVNGNALTYTDNLYSNEKGIEFYYKVCAVISEGSQSAFTGLALGYSAKAGAPTAPTNVKVTNGNGVSTEKLDITWDAKPTHKVEVTPGNTKDYIVSYAVYRTSSVDSIFTLVSNNITTGYVSDMTAKEGIKYYYYVQTIATNPDDTNDKIKSSFSQTGPSTPNEAVGWLLSPPSNCEVIDSDDASKYTIRWTPAVGAETSDYMYNIYSSDTMDGVYELLAFDLQPEKSIFLGSNGYYSFDVDRKSFYRLTTTIDYQGISAQSNQGAIIAPSPSAPVNVTATKTDSLGGLDNFTANNNGVYPVKITWAKPAGENPYGYYVYRSTKPDSSFRKITDEPITDALSFIDENESARPGTLYYYKVVSLNVLMQGKNANEQTLDSRGYGALTRDQWFREYNKTVKRSQAKFTLMHKDGTSALGSESIRGDICGTGSYDASMAGLGARILMHYEKYADYYINNDPAFGYYFLLTGDTNTTANMSANGTMDGTNTASTEGMYPGYAKYDKIQIKGGGAGGGTYVVCTKDKNGNTILAESDISWTVGEE